MAKSSGFFTVRNGSTKSHTYAVYGGKQITKSHMGKMSNPRTESQILARIVAKSCMTAWHSLEPFSYNMFQNFPYGNKTKDRFLTINSFIQKRDMYRAKDPSNFVVRDDDGSQIKYPSHFRISEGSLMPLSSSLIDEKEYSRIFVNGDFTWENWRKILGVQGDAALCYVTLHLTKGLSFTRWFIPAYLKGEMKMHSQLKMQQFGHFRWFPYIDIQTHSIMWTYDGFEEDDYDGFGFSARGYVISNKRRSKWLHSTCELDVDREVQGVGNYKYALEQWPKTIDNTYTDDTIWVVPMK